MGAPREAALPQYHQQQYVLRKYNHATTIYTCTSTIHSDVYTTLSHFRYLHRVFVRVAKVNWLRVVSIHKSHETIHKIIHKLKRSGLTTGAVDSNIFPLQGLETCITTLPTAAGRITVHNCSMPTYTSM